MPIDALAVFNWPDEGLLVDFHLAVAQRWQQAGNSRARRSQVV